MCKDASLQFLNRLDLYGVIEHVLHAADKPLTGQGFPSVLGGHTGMVSVQQVLWKLGGSESPEPEALLEAWSLQDAASGEAKWCGGGSARACGGAPMAWVECGWDGAKGLPKGLAK